MEQPKLTLALAAISAGGLLAGCGLNDPYQHRPPPSTTTPARSTTSTAANAGDPAPERDGTIPAHISALEDRIPAGAGSTTARAAVDRYARIYMNWRAGTLAADQRKLERISISAARQQAQQAAASASTDTQLTADHVSNTGQIVSATRGAGPATGQWVIVTSEKTIGTGDYAGLPPAVHVTYAKVTHTSQGWVITQWAPQN